MKKSLFIIFLIVIVLEVTVFNINSYRILNDNNKVEITAENFDSVIVDEDYTLVEIKDINTEIKTVHINMDFSENAEYQVLYTDKTSSSYMELPSKEYVSKLEKSKYIPCYLSGESTDLAVKVFYLDAPIESITINEKIPFEFNICRVIIIFGIIAFIYLLNTREIFKIPYSLKNFKQEIVLIVILLIFMFLADWLVAFSKLDSSVSDIYSKDFVEALSKGQIYLEEEPSEKLMELDNPYDPCERSKAGLFREKDYPWDVAYYNGKYYIYFGIIPALVLMLPYYLITKKLLSTAFAILFFSILTAVSLKALVENIFLRFFKDVPFKYMVFSFLILLFGSQILWLDGTPRFYELAIISGIFFSVTGINFMFLATKKDEINYWYVFFSALFLSLAVACRPTQLLVSFIILPVIVRIFIKNIKAKKNIGKTVLAVGLPYGVIGGLLMYYNYIRFGSILEFGASYQLTINDMSNLGNRIMTIWTGIVCSLFSIPNFIPTFPFLANHNDLATFYGFYYIEDMMGGLFAMVPICLYIFGIFKVWKRSKNKKLVEFITTFIIVGLSMCLLSIVMGGSMQRYIADYAWILIVAGICVYLELMNLYKAEETKTIMRKLLGVITIYIVLVNLCAGITSEKSYFRKNSPYEYYNLRYLISFWE